MGLAVSFAVFSTAEVLQPVGTKEVSSEYNSSQSAARTIDGSGCSDDEVTLTTTVRNGGPDDLH